jgi:polar amino acid transport system permease protein
MTWNWSYVWGFLPQLMQGAIVTIEATLAGSLIAMTVGLAFAIARRSQHAVVRVITGWVVQFIRGTPLLVQLYFIFFVLPDFGIVLPAFAAGVIGLGIHYACYTSEVYRAGIASVELGQWDAATACNLRSRETWIYVILPQAIPKMVPALANYVIGMFKETALLSAISVFELMSRAQAIGNNSYRYTEPLTVVGLIFLVITLISGRLLRWLENDLRAKGLS